jgi:hypothetical protein
MYIGESNRYCMKLVTMWNGSNASKLPKVYTKQRSANVLQLCLMHIPPYVTIILNSIILYCAPPWCAACTAHITAAKRRYTIRIARNSVISLYFQRTLRAVDLAGIS